MELPRPHSCIFRKNNHLVIKNVQSCVAHCLPDKCSGHSAGSRGSGRLAQGLDEESCSMALQAALHIDSEPIGVCVIRCFSARYLVCCCLCIHYLNDNCEKLFFYTYSIKLFAADIFHLCWHGSAFSTCAPAQQSHF